MTPRPQETSAIQDRRLVTQNERQFPAPKVAKAPSASPTQGIPQDCIR